jgi:hypothetical protein
MPPSYLGLIIEQSLRDPSFLEGVEIVRRHRDPNGTWVFLLVRVPRFGAEAAFQRLQASLDPAPWYAHFFAGDDLVVIYRDAIFSMTTDPATWAAAIAHGVGLGIPEAQLDFWPRTVAQAEERFGGAIT